MANKFLTDIGNSLKAVGSRVKNFGIKHSPEIFFCVGTAAVVGSVVVAIKKTAEPNEDVVQLKEDIKRTNEYAEAHVSDEEGSEYTSEDYKKDKQALALRAVGSYSLNYAPSAALLIIGIASYSKGQAIQKSRTVTAIAAGGAILAKFNQYRERVRERFGDDVDYELMNGIEVVATLPDGTEVLDKPPEDKKKQLDLSNPIRIFDACSSKYTKNPDYNIKWVRMMEEQLNVRNYLSGYMSFNQVCYLFDVPKDMTEIDTNDPRFRKFKGTNLKMGDILGWTYDKNITHKIAIKIANEDKYAKQFNPALNDVDDDYYQGDDSLVLMFNPTDILVDYIAV